MAKVGFIGTGEIASCMVAGLAGSGHEIMVSERNAQTAQNLAARFDDVSVHPNPEIASNADIVFLCLMASTAKSVLPELQFHADQQIVSAMADVKLAELSALCAPATEISITIPMPFIATGDCPLPVFPPSPALEVLFGADNIVLPVATEDALNAHFAAGTISSVVFDQLKCASGWLAGVTGDEGGAEAYLSSLFYGYFNQMRRDGSGEFEGYLQALSTEGGFNATLRQHMDKMGALEALRGGLDAFRPRLGLKEE